MQRTVLQSIRGKMRPLRAVSACGVDIVSRGRLLRTAEIFDEYWLPQDSIPDPTLLVAELKRGNTFADVFTFTHKVPDCKPMHPYRYLWDNVAVLPISSYEAWFKEQIPATTRRHIRASEKKGSPLPPQTTTMPMWRALCPSITRLPFELVVASGITVKISIP